MWTAHTHGARAGVLQPSGRGKRPPVQVVINKRLMAASSLKVARQLDACRNHSGAPLGADSKA